MKQWLHKHKVLLAAIVLCLGTVFAVTGFLHSHGKLKEPNPIRELCETRSHIAVTGEKYTLDQEQEATYLDEINQLEERQQELPPKEKVEPEPEREEEKKPVGKPVIPQEVHPSEQVPSLQSPQPQEGGEQQKDPAPHEQVKPQGGEMAGGGGGSGEGVHGDNTGGNHEPSKLPTIICSLSDGQEIEGKFLSFTVQAKSYTNEVLDSFFIDVRVNGNKMYSSGDQNGVISYRTSQELLDGNNEVTITVTDREKNQATKTYNVIIKTEEMQKVGGTMMVTVRADTLGLGTILKEKVTFYEGENLPYIVDRAFRQAGIQYEHTGTFDYGFYLSRIHQSGITNGYTIPAPILAKLEDENSSWVGFEENSLGEKDFYYWSGWVYRLDGFFPGGLSTVPAEDGSEMEMLFTLNNGAEYNGTWFHGNW